MTPKEWTDADLLERVLSKDRCGWPELLRRFGQLIRYSLMRYAKDLSVEDRDEVYNDVVVQLLRDDMRELRKFDASRAKLGTWIALQAQWMAGHFRRRAKRFPVVGKDTDMAESGVRVADESLTIDQIVDRDCLDRVESFISTLKARDQTFYDLHYRQGLSPENIAKAMGCSRQAVSMRKQKLEARLAYAFNGAAPSSPRSTQVPNSAQAKLAHPEPTLAEVVDPAAAASAIDEHDHLAETETQPDPAVDHAERNPPEVLQPLSLPPRPVRMTPKRPPTIRQIATAAQLKAAHTIVDYAETHAVLAFPTPAGQEAIALLDCAIDFAGPDVETAELHRLGLIRLVVLGASPGLDRSLRLRGHRPHGPRVTDDAVMIDGVAHDGVMVAATPTPISDALDVAELVWMAAEKPLDDFLDHVWTVAKGDDEKAAGAKLMLCREWDRIRGVLPALSSSEDAAMNAAREVPATVAQIAPALMDACSTVEQPPTGVGRPRLPIRDVLFAVVVMAGTRSSSRAVARDLPALHAAGYVSAPMHHNALTRALRDPLISDALIRVAEEAERRTGVPAQPASNSAEDLAAAVWRSLSLVTLARSETRP